MNNSELIKELESIKLKSESKMNGILNKTPKRYIPNFSFKMPKLSIRLKYILRRLSLVTYLILNVTLIYLILDFELDMSTVIIQSALISLLFPCIITLIYLLGNIFFGIIQGLLEYITPNDTEMKLIQREKNEKKIKPYKDKIKVINELISELK